MYKLPLGIKILQKEDYPEGYDVKKIDSQRNSANIIMGYKYKTVIGEKYTYYVKINADADILWEVFVALSESLIQENAHGLIAFKKEEPGYSKLIAKDTILKIFEPYIFELVNDGFLEFGIINSDKKALSEIFVTSFKYLKVWTNDMDTLVTTLKRFQINEISNLRFIDEFPVQSNALKADKKSGIRNYSEVIESIKNEFNKCC